MSKILIIEDNPTHSRLLKECLEPFGEVETAFTSKEALEKISSNGFNLIIADIRMPAEKNKESIVDEGYRICKFIKEKGNINKTIVITIVADEEETIKRLCKLGIKKKFILHKPPNIEEIRKLADSLLKSSVKPSTSKRPRRNYEYQILVEGEIVWRGLELEEAVDRIEKEYPNKKIHIRWEMKGGGAIV